MNLGQIVSIATPDIIRPVQLRMLRESYIAHQAGNIMLRPDGLP